MKSEVDVGAVRGGVRRYLEWMEQSGVDLYDVMPDPTKADDDDEVIDFVLNVVADTINVNRGDDSVSFDPTDHRVRDVCHEELVRGEYLDRVYEQVRMPLIETTTLQEARNEKFQMTESMKYHVMNEIPIDENMYRPGSSEFFRLFREARRLVIEGVYTPDPVEYEWLVETDIGEWGLFEGQKVPLDFPMLAEAEYQGRDVELGKPKRGSGGKAYVYVRDPKSGNVKKVTFGSSMPDAMGDSEAHRKRRKSYSDRHKCGEKKDRTKAGYWSCRATKFFGRDIPGYW